MNTFDRLHTTKYYGRFMGNTNPGHYEMTVSLICADVLIRKRRRCRIRHIPTMNNIAGIMNISNTVPAIAKLNNVDKFL